MPIVTPLCKKLGITHPVICGGMHYVGYGTLAAAVSEAGGLGTITALTQKSPEDLRAEIRKVKSLTKKPFAVNLTLLPALRPPNYGAYVDVIIEEGVKICETAGRNPAEFIKKLSDAGIFVIHKCTTVKHAKTARRHGAQAITMDGLECGGHPGESDVGGWVLLAQAARELDIPFLAAGGIATGRQLAAALAFGAQAVVVGTAFMATKEAPVLDGIKEALVKGKVTDTTLVMRSLRNTERVFKNPVAKKVQEIEAKEPGSIMAIRHLVSGENYRKSFQETGDPTTSVWSCGQGMGLIDDIPTCEVFINRMVAEAEDVIANKLQGLVVRRSRL